MTRGKGKCNHNIVILQPSMADENNFSGSTSILNRSAFGYMFLDADLD